jgi:hypothetical protein
MCWGKSYCNCITIPFTWGHQNGLPNIMKCSAMLREHYVILRLRKASEKLVAYRNVWGTITTFHNT